MGRKPKGIVLDTWAVLAYLADESAGERVADVIATAHEEGTPLMMTTVNAGEVWYILARRVSESEADQGISGLRQLGIEFVDADWSLARQTGVFKSRYRMSFADCFAAALARETRADLVTGDQEFQQVAAEVKIAWL
jgi:predicted nucleic acid-binding protein